MTDNDRALELRIAAISDRFQWSAEDRARRFARLRAGREQYKGQPGGWWEPDFDAVAYCMEEVDDALMYMARLELDNHGGDVACAIYCVQANLNRAAQRLDDLRAALVREESCA